MRHATPPVPSRLRAARNLAVLAGLLAGLAAVGAADKLPPDPIENFNKALQTEKSDSLDARLEGKALKLAIDFRRKNLTRASKELRTLSDVSQALLLPNWPIEDTSDYDKDARVVDGEIRQALVERFVKGVREVFEEGTPQRKAAVAILLGETAIASAADVETTSPVVDRKATVAAATRENLFRELSRLTPDLAKLVDSDSPLVRGSASRSLGQFPRRPYTVARALDRVLAHDKEVRNRRAASASLVTLIQTVTGAEPNVASEPGILTRETRRNKRLFTSKDRVAVWAAVIPVASRGLSDPDVRVRRNSASAIQQATGALSQEIYLTSRDPLFKSFPPKERKEITPAERRRIQEGYKEIEKFEDLIKPAIAALTKSRAGGRTVPEAMTAAACDEDLEVRLGVRRTFDEMARARRFLNDLRNLLPRVEEPEPLDPPKNEPDKKGKEDNKEKEVDAGVSQAPTSRVQLVSGEAPPVLTLPPPPTRFQIAQEKEEKEKEEKKKKEDNEKLNLPKNKNDEPEFKKKEKDEDEDPFAKVKVDPDALGKTLVAIGDQLIGRGVVDPNAAGRRASLEAVEALGETGAQFIPALIRSLKDPDRFCRWIAARALGKLAPARSAEVVPALVCMLDEFDLDVRIAAIDALGQYNSTAASAVPALAERLGKGDSESRLAAMRALEYVGRAAAPALPALRPLLTNVDPRLRAEAARLIGKFGAEGSPYVADLQKMLNDPDSEVRRAASAAIISITQR